MNKRIDNKPIIKLSDFISSLRIDIRNTNQTKKPISFYDIRYELPKDYNKLKNIDDLNKNMNIMIFVDENYYYPLIFLNTFDSDGKKMFQFTNYIFEDYNTLKNMVSKGIVFSKSISDVLPTLDNTDLEEIEEKKQEYNKLSELIDAPMMFPRSSPILPSNYDVLKNVNDFIKYKDSVIFIAVGNYYHAFTLLDLKGFLYKFSDNIITSFPTFKKLVDLGSVFIPSPEKQKTKLRKRSKSPIKSTRNSSKSTRSKSPIKSTRNSSKSTRSKSPIKSTRNSPKSGSVCACSKKSSKKK
jgi:hypothetical protein